MQARLIRRRQQFVRVDMLSVVIYPLIAVVFLVLVGGLLIRLGVVKSFYASPFVLASAFVSNRVCLRAGLVTALLSCLAHEYFFSAPYREINVPTAEQALAYVSNFAVAWAVARRMPAPPLTPPPLGRQSQPLPFESSSKDTTTKSFWTVRSSHDWLEDCEVGSEYGRIYLEHMRSGHAFPALGWIIKDMVRQGKWTGVEHGFAAAIHQAAREPVAIPVNSVSPRQRDADARIGRPAA